jgi:NAD(P)-dependent dehydrogenase (short-subunit alcohol dehydrogenase family)
MQGEHMDLVGRHVLVTGASRGIGRVLAQRFAAAGSRVALVARGAEDLEELARAVGGAAYPADLVDPASAG